jgi:organic radical activating enzyme
MWKFFRKQYKKKLDNVSTSLCLAKWTQSNIYLASGTTHSCHHPNTHVIPLHEIKNNPGALHNTSYKISQRKLMLSNVRPSECDYCWRVEDQGNISDRVTKSFTSWARPFFKEIVKHGAELDIPKYIEVSFDNTCNLKCSYCGPQFSSKWVEELQQQGAWPSAIDYYNSFKIIRNNEENPYIDAFWKWFPAVYTKLHTFRITGGEPLLSKNTFKVLDQLIETPNRKLHLGVNTNLAVPDKSLDLFIEKVKKLKVKSLTIHTSCDAHGSAAEYARHGLDYNKWLKNCQRILDEIPNAKLDVMVTYNIFSVTTFIDFLKDISVLKRKRWFQKQRVSVSIGYLRSPKQLAIWVLPKEYVSHIAEQLAYMKVNKFTKTEINQLERLVSLFDHNKETQDTLQQQFKMFVQEHDRRRGTNLTTSIPSLTSFYQSCK